MPDDPIGEIRALGLPPPNYDERNLSTAPPALVRPGRVIDATTRREWLSRFAGQVYGTIPPSPESIEIERQPELLRERRQEFVERCGHLE